MAEERSRRRTMKNIPWLGRSVPAMRSEAHYGDRVVECFIQRPAGFFDLFARAVRRNPGGEAIVFQRERITWQELDRKVSSAAATLADRGVRAGDRVALFVGNRPEFVITLYATLRLGAVVVPLGIRQQRQELSYAIADCAAS